MRLQCHVAKSPSHLDASVPLIENVYYFVNERCFLLSQARTNYRCEASIRYVRRHNATGCRLAREEFLLFSAHRQAYNGSSRKRKCRRLPCSFFLSCSFSFSTNSQLCRDSCAYGAFQHVSVCLSGNRFELNCTTRMRFPVLRVLMPVVLFINEPALAWILNNRFSV